MLWLNYSERNNHIEKFPIAVKHTDHRFVRRNFSRVTFHSLKFTRCSLLVVKSLITRCKICSLLVAEVTRCKKLLVSHCKIRSLLVAEVARWKNSLVTRCKKSLDTRCEMCLLLAATNHLLFNAKNHSSLVKTITSPLKKGEKFSFFNVNCFQEPKNSKLFQVNIIS